MLMIEIFLFEVNIAFFGQSPFRPVFSEPVGDWWLLLQQFSALINLVLKNESFFCQNFLAKKLSWIIYQRLIAKVQLLLSKEREKEKKICWLEQQIDIKLRPFNVFPSVSDFCGCLKFEFLKTELTENLTWWKTRFKVAFIGHRWKGGQHFRLVCCGSTMHLKVVLSSFLDQITNFKTWICIGADVAHWSEYLSANLEVVGSHHNGFFSSSSDLQTF